MKIRQAIAAILAALAATAAFPALAQSTASASVGNLSYQLIDLDPYDGITPYLTWGASTTFATSYLFSDPNFNNIAATATDPTSATLTNDDGIANAFASPSRVSTITLMNHNSGWTLAYYTADFTLSPHTRLIFTVDAAVDAEPDFTEGGLGFAYAQADLFGQVANDASGGMVNFGSSIYSNRFGEQRPLSAVVDSQGQEAYGSVWMQANAQASSLSPAPEPDSLAMLAAGLAVLTGAARRRARRG